MRRELIVAAFASLASACAPVASLDYSPYRAHMPRSIVVLPPQNETTDVNAPYVYLSTITRPLAESGYYVFPVAVVDAYMKENGLPTAGEMHGVSLGKLREVFGADAVLYVKIEDWGQKYRILTSDSVVKARATLVDTVSGTRLWSGVAFAAQSSAAGQSDPIGMLIGSVVTQVLSTITDPAHQLAESANAGMVTNHESGMLLGPYSPGAAADVRGR